MLKQIAPAAVYLAFFSAAFVLVANGYLFTAIAVASLGWGIALEILYEIEETEIDKFNRNNDD